MTSSFNNFVIERSILAIPHASYNKGSKGTGGAFDLPTQVTIKYIICVRTTHLTLHVLHMHMYMHIQSLRQRQLRLKTTPLFPKRKRRAASGGTRTRDVHVRMSCTTTNRCVWLHTHTYMSKSCKLETKIPFEDKASEPACQVPGTGSAR